MLPSARRLAFVDEGDYGENEEYFDVAWPLMPGTVVPALGEQRRPRLTSKQWVFIGAGLMAIFAVVFLFAGGALSHPSKGVTQSIGLAASGHEIPEMPVTENCSLNGFFQPDNHVHTENLFHADPKWHRAAWGEGSMSSKGQHYIWSTGKYKERDWIHKHSRMYSKSFVITNETDIQLLTRGGVGANTAEIMFNKSSTTSREGVLEVVIRRVGNDTVVSMKKRSKAAWDLEELRFTPWELREAMGDKVRLEIIDTYSGNYSWGWLGVRSISIFGAGCPDKTESLRLKGSVVEPKKPKFPMPLDTSTEELLPCSLSGFYASEKNVQDFFCDETWGKHWWSLSASMEQGTVPIFTHRNFTNKTKDDEHKHTMIKSKPFWVTLGTTIQILTRGGTGKHASWTDFDEKKDTTEDGVLGVALIRVRDDKWLVNKSRTKASWNIEEIRFNPADMRPFFGEEVVLAIVDTYHAKEMGWLGVHSISLSGIECENPTCDLKAEKNRSLVECSNTSQLGVLNGFWHAANMKHSARLFEATDEWHYARWGAGSLSGEGQHFLWSPGNYQVRDKQHQHARIRTKPFVITKDTDLLILTRGGTGAGAKAIGGFNRENLTSNTKGFLGVVVRKVSNGKWILNKTRQRASWELEDLHLQPWDFREYIGQEATLDIVDTFHGDYNWGWLGVRAISIHGTGCSHQGDLDPVLQDVPEPLKEEKQCKANFFYNAEMLRKEENAFCPNGGLDDFRHHIVEKSNWTHHNWTFQATNKTGPGADFHLVSVGSFGDANKSHNQSIFRTRPFWLTNTTDIQLLCRGGTGNATSITSFNAESLSTPTGFMGAAIRTYDDNRTFLVSKRRNFSAWELDEIRFSHEDLKNFTGKYVELDIIDAYHAENGEIGWFGIHSLFISGANCTSDESMSTACNETLIMSDVPPDPIPPVVPTVVCGSVVAAAFCCSPAHCLHSLIHQAGQASHGAKDAAHATKDAAHAVKKAKPSGEACAKGRKSFVDANHDSLVRAINMSMPEGKKLENINHQDNIRKAKEAITKSLEAADCVIELQKTWMFYLKVVLVVLALITAYLYQPVRDYVLKQFREHVLLPFFGAILIKSGLAGYVERAAAYAWIVDGFSLIEDWFCTCLEGPGEMAHDAAIERANDAMDEHVTADDASAEKEPGAPQQPTEDTHCDNKTVNTALAEAPEKAFDKAEDKAMKKGKDEGKARITCGFRRVCEWILDLMDHGGRKAFTKTFNQEIRKAGVNGITVEWKRPTADVRSHLKALMNTPMFNGEEGFGACVHLKASDEKMTALMDFYKKVSEGKVDKDADVAKASEVFKKDEDSPCKKVADIFEKMCIVIVILHSLITCLSLWLSPEVAVFSEVICIVIVILYSLIICLYDQTKVCDFFKSVYIVIVIPYSLFICLCRWLIPCSEGAQQAGKVDKDEGEVLKDDKDEVDKDEGEVATDAADVADSLKEVTDELAALREDGACIVGYEVKHEKIARCGWECCGLKEHEIGDLILEDKGKDKDKDKQTHKLSTDMDTVKQLYMSFVIYTVDADEYKLSCGWKEPVVEVCIEEPEPIVHAPYPAPSHPLPPTMDLPPPKPCVPGCSTRCAEAMASKLKFCASGV